MRSSNTSRIGLLVGLGGIQVLAMLFTVARSKAVAFALGPSGVGAISLVDQVVGLAGQVFALSLPFAAVKFLSAAHGEGRERFAGLYGAFAWPLIGLTVAGTGACVVAVWWWPSLLGREFGADGRVATLALLSIPGVTLTSFFASAMAASQRSRASGLYGLWNVVLLAVLSIAGLGVAGLPGYYAGNLAAAVLVGVAGAAYIARTEGARLGPIRSGIGELVGQPGVVGFASTLYLAAFAQPAAYLVARYAVLRTSGLDGAGLLQSAMALGLALFVIMRQPSALLLVPAMNRGLPRETKFREALAYSRTFALVVGGAALPLVLFPELWVYALYSRRFLGAAPYAYLFVAAQMLKLFSGVPIAVLVGLDAVAAQLVITLLGLGTLAWLSWVLTPTLGLAGVGTAFLSEGVVAFGLSLWWLKRRYQFPVIGAIAWPLIALAVIVMVGTLSAAYDGMTPAVLFAKGVAGIVLVSAGLAVAWRRGLLAGEHP